LTLLAQVYDPCVTPNSLPNLVGLLLKYNAKVNHESLDDITPLRAAIASGSTTSILALIDAGADPSCAESGVNIIAELMHQSSYQRCLQPPSAESQAEAEARVQDIVRILKGFHLGSPRGLRASKVDKDNGSLLHYAARAGLVDCVAVLINTGLGINLLRSGSHVTCES
jgi:ankyrin repeat protein